MAKKKLNPIIANILQRLEVDEKANLTDLKIELTEKHKRIQKTIMTVERGLAGLKTREKHKSENNQEDYLKIDSNLKRYLFKQAKRILAA